MKGLEEGENDRQAWEVIKGNIIAILSISAMMFQVPTNVVT